MKYEYTMGRELDLKAEQEKTLNSPVMSANFILRGMYLTMDLLYGFKRTLPKFMVIELLARYPYWAWENGSYYKVSKDYTSSGYTEKAESDKAIRLIEVGREAQDNEQWHLMLIEDIMKQKGIELGWFKKTFMPFFMTLTYFYLTRIMYWMKPEWSFAMNAAFESHAEHEYMKLVEEHPEWDEEEVDSPYFEFYPKQETMGDLFRRIGLDERDHMFQSLEEIERIKGTFNPEDSNK